MAFLGLWPSWAYGLSDLESWVYDFLLLSPLQPVIICCPCHTACPFTLGPSFSHAYPSFTEARRDEARREEKSVACDNGLMNFLLLSLLQSGPLDNVFV